MSDKPNEIPKHVAIIMDGNGRWAQQQGADRIFGHHEGVNSVREVVEAAAEKGVQYLTLYAFSTENWGRPKDEVDGLMELLVNTLKKEIKSLHDNRVKLETIGSIDHLPELCQTNLAEAIEATSKNTGLILILALSYSGRWEIARAAKKIASDASLGKINPDDVDEIFFSNYLSTSGVPDPELLIRTSGEMRISNFLLWQLAYTEFFITSKLWPDFRKEDLYEAITSYQHRERRFGKITEPSI